MNIPDFMPRLRRGAGNSPKDGGCLVQVAGYLNDGVSWTDQTPCVHPLLRHVAIGVNDSVSDESRQGLLGFAPRLIGTGDRSPKVEIGLVEWCMRQHPERMSIDREDAYQRFLNESRYGTYAWYASGDPSTRSASWDVAGYTLRDLFTFPPVISTVSGLDPWGSFYQQAKLRPQQPNDEDMIAFLGEFIDEYDRITGREVSGKTVTEEDWQRVKDAMCAA